MSSTICAGSHELAKRFDLPLHCGEPGIVLERGPDGLRLRDNREGAPGPLRADFNSADVRRRVKAGARLPLARAVGVRGGARRCVLDATAGLGRDAYVLAALGYDVIAAERSPVIAAMATDALDRAGTEAAGRVRLVVCDAVDLMRGMNERPDVVYLDPMFTGRAGSAQVKKEMQYFRALLGEGEDGVRLLEPAMRCARERVVVKRHAKGPPLVESPKVNHTIEGKTVRFDVYLAPTDTP